MGAFKVELGSRKVISAIGIEFHSEGGPELSVSVLVPVTVPNAPQPVYKPIACAVRITEDQRRAIVAALEGKTPNERSAKDGPAEGEGTPSVEANKPNPGRG